MVDQHLLLMVITVYFQCFSSLISILNTRLWQVYYVSSANNDLYYKEGSNVYNLTNGSSGIVGETNTASNVGAATNAEIFVQKSGLDFEFNSLNGTEGIAVVNGANSEVTFALDLNNLTDNADLQAASDYAVMYDASAGAHHKVELEHLANLLAITDNVSANSAPINTDDSNSGYSVGSRWIDTTNNKAYICLDTSPGAAVWEEITDDDSNKVETNGSSAMTGNLNMNSNKITNLAAPTAANDASLC